MIITINNHDCNLIDYCAAPVHSNRSGTNKTKCASVVCESTDRWALRATSKLLHVLLDFLQSLSLAVPAGHPESSLKPCQS